MTSTDLTIEQTDILRLLSSKVHLGAEKINHAMKRYVDSKNNVGNYIFDLNETYKKIKLAARIIASVKNLAEVIVLLTHYVGCLLKGPGTESRLQVWTVHRCYCPQFIQMGPRHPYQPDDQEVPGAKTPHRH